MARTRAAHSQSQDASHKALEAQTLVEEGRVREVNEVGVELTGARDPMNLEQACVHGDFVQGNGLVNGSENASGLVNGGGSARGSGKASARLLAPVENPQHDCNGPTMNVFPQTLPLLQEREGLRRLRERDAVKNFCNQPLSCSRIPVWREVKQSGGRSSSSIQLV